VNHTDEQAAILGFIKAGKGDLIVEAGAGCGKTYTLLASLAVMPQRSVLLCAFNKRIAEALQARLPQMPATHVVHVKTFHAQGLAILKKKFPHLSGPNTVSPESTEELVNRVSGLAPKPLAFKGRRVAVKLLRHVKEVVITNTEVNQIIEVGHEHNVFGDMKDRDIDHIVEVVFEAYKLGKDFSKRETIDFCDMVWGPLILDLPPPSRYQAVIVDECQDLSWPQLYMLKQLIAPGGRFIGIGDFNQCIYGWRGAVPEKVFAEFDARKAVKLPLTITFRCAQSIVKLANELVPSLRALEDAPIGIVEEIDYEMLAETLRTKPAPVPLNNASMVPHTFVLSRTNADLLSCALKLWSQRVPFQLNAGKEMLEPLYIVLDNLKTSGTSVEFQASLAAWYAAEAKRAEAANATAWAERLEEQYAMLRVAADYAAPNKIRKLLTDMITLEGTGILLSSVHKVKGLEAHRVFLLRQTFARYAGRVDKNGEPLPPSQEDLNIEYVAITRAKHTLVWVNL
jgi:superfamily I DNA/RNA helicase